jgi:hypothetical protein
MSRDETLKSIGWEMDDLIAAGTFDFPAFQRLFFLALAACGPDTNDLETFLASAKDSVWRDWMMRELQKTPFSLGTTNPS